MKKILFVHTSFGILGGVERALINLLYALPRDRYEIDLLMLDRRGLLFAQLPKHVNTLPPLTQFTKWSPELMSRLRESGMTHMADVRERVHAWNLEDETKDKRNFGEQHNRNWEELKTICPTYEGYDVAVAYSHSSALKIVSDRVRAKKKIAWIHVDWSYCNFSAKSQIRYFLGMDRVVCVTEQNAEVFRNAFPDMTRVITLPNIIDAELLANMADEYAPREYDRRQINIFTAGRLCEQKGIDLLILAARIMRDRGMNFVWVVAGEKEKGWESYLELAEMNNVIDAVTFIGTADNPYPYFKHCDVYVQPSRFEGKPVAIDEAKLLGCPIVAARYSSVSDSIEHERTGLICDMNAESIAFAVMRLAQDEALRKNLRENLRGFVYDNRLSDYVALFDGTNEDNGVEKL
jgi:glycosyltransferase involved in cell wall biosynthesis